MFDRAVATKPRTVALRHLGVALTYQEMGRAVAALARRFSLTLVPGEVIALVLPNSIEFQISYFAALKALTAPALLNPLYPAAQLAPLLRDVAPRAVLCAPATRDIVTRLAYELGIPNVVCLGRDVSVRDLVAEPTKPMSLRTADPDRFRSAVLQRRYNRNSQGCRAHARPPRLRRSLHGTHLSETHR